MADSIYDTVLREWIAQRIRGRGHKDMTRDKVRNVRLGIDQGFRGSDVTPADDPEAAIECEIKVSDQKLPWTDAQGWHEHHEPVFSMPDLLEECVAILEKLSDTGA